MQNISSEGEGSLQLNETSGPNTDPTPSAQLHNLQLNLKLIQVKNKAL